jgi:hypothetical protein
MLLLAFALWDNDYVGGERQDFWRPLPGIRFPIANREKI